MTDSPQPSRTIPPPTPDVLEHIRRHHHEVHSLELDAERDIYNARATPPEAIYDWTPANPRSGARFHCELCGQGFIGIAGEPPRGTPERRAFLQRTDPHLQALLAGTPPERHDDLVDAYDRRELGPAMLAATNARKRRQVAVRHNPAYQRRIDGFRHFFLDTYAKVGSIERSCEQLVDLHATDPGRYREVLGADRLYALQTFLTYVKQHTTAEERQSQSAVARCARVQAVASIRPPLKCDTRARGYRYFARGCLAVRPDP